MANENGNGNGNGNMNESFPITKTTQRKNAMKKAMEIENGMIVIAGKKYPNQPDIYIVVDGKQYNLMIMASHGRLNITAFMPDDGEITIRGVGVEKIIMQPIDKDYPNQQEISMIAESGEKTPDSTQSDKMDGE